MLNSYKAYTMRYVEEMWLTKRLTRLNTGIESQHAQTLLRDELTVCHWADERVG